VSIFCFTFFTFFRHLCNSAYVQFLTVFHQSLLKDKFLSIEPLLSCNLQHCLEQIQVFRYMFFFLVFVYFSCLKSWTQALESCALKTFCSAILGINIISVCFLRQLPFSITLAFFAVRLKNLLSVVVTFEMQFLKKCSTHEYQNTRQWTKL